MLRPDEIDRLVANWDTDAKLDGMVWRWRSNDSVPPQECMEIAFEYGLVTREQMDASALAREAEIAAFFEAYKAAQAAVPSEEEQFEMRAAYGPGVEVVDVISGRKWTT